LNFVANLVANFVEKWAVSTKFAIKFTTKFPSHSVLGQALLTAGRRKIPRARQAQIRVVTATTEKKTKELLAGREGGD
jgi:hypothetical protein